MATVNYSIPDEVKERFNRTFADRNRSALIAELMQRAVDEHEQQERRARAVDRLLKLRERTPPVAREAVRIAREEGRP
jgi:metal-responsive CopG/Arc/MetJ family transcriptional regulator